jgi:hypothetical protein
MTDASVPAAGFAEGDFQVGRVFNRTFSMLSRNLLPFCLVTGVAALPNVLVEQNFRSIDSNTGAWIALTLIATPTLNALSQAVVLYGAFEDMLGRPVDLVESFKIGLRRFFPVLGVAILVPLIAGVAALALVFPAFMVMTMLFVATPVCVVERLGPIKSMDRSARLTKGHRWKIFGVWIAVFLVAVTAESMLTGIGGAIGGPVLEFVAGLLNGAVFGAFNAILAVVAYHDLRVAKEGVNTDQIAAVFD